jgi:hypothetical protein
MLDLNKVRLQVCHELRPFTDISKSLQQLISHDLFDMLAKVLGDIYQAEAEFDRSRVLTVRDHMKVIVPCMVNEIWTGTSSKLEAKTPQTQRGTRRISPSPEGRPYYTPAKGNSSPHRLSTRKAESPIVKAGGSPLRKPLSPQRKPLSPQRKPLSPQRRLDSPRKGESPIKKAIRGYNDQRRVSSPGRLNTTPVRLNGSPIRQCSTLSRFNSDFIDPSHTVSASSLSYKESRSFSDFGTVTGPSPSFSRSKRTLTRGNDESPGPAAYQKEVSGLVSSTPRTIISLGGKKGELFHPPSTPGPAAYYVMRQQVSKH